MNKLRAYTMMEMIVVMIIGVIVIGIAYKTYDIVFRQLLSSQRANEKMADLVLLHTQMVCDFADADYVVSDLDGFVCHYKTRNVQYALNDEHIIRRDSVRSDTFYLVTENRSYRFQRKVVEGKLKLIDEFTFMGYLSDSIQFFNYRKQYAADVLMQFNNQKEESYAGN
jgi:prepilin-type N-terminal cleavage/methylation domain-containing protein